MGDSFMYFAIDWAGNGFRYSAIGKMVGGWFLVCSHRKDGREMVLVRSHQNAAWVVVFWYVSSSFFLAHIHF